MTKKERAAQAVSILKERYPQAVCSLVYDKEKPYELVIATRLSAQCTDARVNIVTKELFARYDSLEAFANADLAEVEEIVKPCGFFRMKAKDTIGMCQAMLSRFDGKVPDTIEELITLPGVGRKTANLIVGDIYHKPSIVTDTHCIRICGRIGLTTGITEPKKVEDALRPILDPAESGDFCHRLVMFGREICTARTPKCDVCPMKPICKEGAVPKKTKKSSSRVKIKAEEA